MNPRRVSFILLVAAGCGGTAEVDLGPTGTVSGFAMIDGKPLAPETQIVFLEPAKGYCASGYLDAGGNYKATSWNDGNLPVGTYKVTVQPPPPPELSAEEALSDHGEKSNPPAEFPEKYREAATSGLEFTIAEGENTYAIELSLE